MGADLLAPLGGLGEAALLRRRKLRQRVQLGAVVETSASEIGERLGVDLLATGDITGDGAFCLSRLFGGVFHERCQFGIFRFLPAASFAGCTTMLRLRVQLQIQCLALGMMHGTLGRS